MNINDDISILACSKNKADTTSCGESKDTSETTTTTTSETKTTNSESKASTKDRFTQTPNSKSGGATTKYKTIEMCEKETSYYCCYQTGPIEFDSEGLVYKEDDSDNLSLTYSSSDTDPLTNPNYLLIDGLTSSESEQEQEDFNSLSTWNIQDTISLLEDEVEKGVLKNIEKLDKEAAMMIPEEEGYDSGCSSDMSNKYWDSDSDSDEEGNLLINENFSNNLPPTNNDIEAKDGDFEEKFNDRFVTQGRVALIVSFVGVLLLNIFSGKS